MRDSELQRIYNQEIELAAASGKAWEEILRMAGQLYRYEFDNILMIHAQKPGATLAADYDTWKKVGRYVKRGSKGVAVFNSKVLPPGVHYVFDISDTGGRDSKLTWTLDDKNLTSYANFLIKEGQIEPFDTQNTQDCVKSLFVFTGTNVWVMIKEEFAERAMEFEAMVGERISGEAFEQGDDSFEEMSFATRFIYDSVMYEVASRCGFDLTLVQNDFEQIRNIHDEDLIYRLGCLVCDISCAALRQVARNFKQMEAERRLNYEHNSTRVQGSGRNLLPDHQPADGAGRGAEPTGQVRSDGAALSAGERASALQEPVPLRPSGAADAGRGDGGQPAARSADGALPEQEQARGPQLHHGDVEASRAGEAAGGGSGALAGGDEVSLEVKNELDELNSFGKKEEAGQFRQASFFDAKEDGKFTYTNPKHETTIPDEYIKQVLLRGTGFENGKRRVIEIMRTEVDAATRAKKIKEEYGCGGCSWPIDAYGLHGYDTFKSTGIRVQWREADGEHVGYLSWRAAEQRIGALLLTGEYAPEKPLAQSISREDDEGVLAAEVKSEEVDTADKVYDDYAIPDEVDELERIEKGEISDSEVVAAIEAEVAPEPAVTQISGWYPIYNARAASNYVEAPVHNESLQQAPIHQEPVQNEPTREEPSPKPPLHNHHINIFEKKYAGPKARFKWNLDAIKLLKQIESENRTATPEEQETLALYVGWGGLAQAFDSTNESWQSEYQQLKEALSEGEYAAARATVNNAFYTPSEVASVINRALVNFGFTGGDVLEPTKGIGTYIGTMPPT